MTTVKDIFEIAMALADSQVDGKAISEINDEYVTRTPMILNVLQNELLKKGKLKTVIEEKIEVTNDWIEVELPEDFSRITTVLLFTEDGQIFNNGFTYYVSNEGDGNTLKVKSEITGTLKIEYLQIPVMLTSLNDALNVSDEIARCVLPYGLVANLFVEENPTVASFCEQKYEENKKDCTSTLSPISLTFVIDSYKDTYYGFN